MDLAQIEQRAATLDNITTAATNDLVSYASTILDESPPRVAAQLRVATPAVIASYGEVAGVAAADWYETVRPVPGFRATVAAPTSLIDDTASMLGWALAPLFTDTDSGVLTRITGGLIRLVSGFDRSTIDANVGRDPFAGKSKRVARPDACAFCAYMSVNTDNTDEDTKRYHDHCRCYPVPFWDTVGVPQLPYEARWEAAAEDARNAIERDYHEKRKLAPDLRRQNFYKKFPETAINKTNILTRMRIELGLH